MNVPAAPLPRGVFCFSPAEGGKKFSRQEENIFIYLYICSGQSEGKMEPRNMQGGGGGMELRIRKNIKSARNVLKYF